MQPQYPLIVGCLSVVYSIGRDLTITTPTKEETTFYSFANERKRVCNPADYSCESFESLHVNFTVSRAPNLTKVITGSGSKCCGFCTCDEDCVQYGSCCLDVYKSFHHALKITKDNRYECVRSQFLKPSESEYNNEFSYWMISKCEPAHSDMKDRQLCENPGQDGSIESMVPVTDSLTRKSYRNKYCYFCNGADQERHLIYWALLIKGAEYIPIPNERLLSILRTQRGNIFFEKPDYVRAQICDFPTFKYSTCNETGFWKKFDLDIDTACNSFIDPFNYTYKNYFCYLCNSADMPPEETWYCPINATYGSISVAPPFFAILDITAAKGEMADVDHLRCVSNQFKDEMMIVCRDVLCHTDRMLVNGGCETKLNRFHNGTCFAVFMKLTSSPKSSKIYSEERIAFIEIRNALMFKLGYDDGVEYKFHVFRFSDTVDQSDFFVAFIAASVVASNKVFHNLVDSILALQNDSIIINDTPDNDIKLVIEVNMYNFTFSPPNMAIFVPNMFDSTVIRLESRLPFEISADSCSHNTLARLNKMLSCPFITLGMKEVAWRVKNDFLSIANIATPNQTLKVFSKLEYGIQGDNISICLDDFIEIYNIMLKSKSRSTTPITSHDQDSVKHILALSCVTLSITCLFITVVTYFKLPTLRSQPGINNLILCIFLFLAQSFYQFGAGQTSLPDFACALIGGICHFLWLCVMFSMNNCCIQMFIIFKKQTKLLSKYKVYKTIKYVLCIICASLVFVFANLIASLLSSGGIKTGYGGSICYLSSPLLQIITFITPSILTLVINISLFFCVVYKIKQISSVNMTVNKQRNYLGVYARLSTLTGLTWAFGFLRLIFEIDALEYLFIVLNAGQGVFIMIAFVLNRRVLSLLLRKETFVSSDTTGDVKATRHETIN